MNTEIATENYKRKKFYLLCRKFLLLVLLFVYFFFEENVFTVSFFVVVLFWIFSGAVLKKEKCIQFKPKKVVFYEKNMKKAYFANRFYKIVYLPFSYDLFLLKKVIKVADKSRIVKQDKIVKQFNLKGFTENQIEQILEKLQAYGKKMQKDLQGVDISLLSGNKNTVKNVNNFRNIDLG